MSTHDTHKPASTTTNTSSSAQRAPEQGTAEPEAERIEQVAAPQLASRLHGQQQARMMQRMQRTVGNAQVQRMLKAAPAQPRPSIKPAETAFTSAILPAQRTAMPVAEVQRTQESAVAAPDTAAVQRTPEPAVVAPSTASVQRTPAPIMRGWDWNPINAGRRLVNAVGNGAQQLARAAFERALRATGVNPARVMGLINRAGGAIGSIISNPGRFANTLVNAVRQGFGRFRNNISTHLQSGFAGWLVGATGVNVPRDFSPPSVLSLVLQVLRINQAGIIGRVAQQAGAGNTEQIQQAQNEIRAATRGGLGGLWPMLQESLGDLKTVVIDGLKQWVTETIVRAAIVRIASMFNPATGIIAAIRMIYDVVTFLIQRAGQIRALFEAVGNSASALAQGNVQQAAARIEQVLARSIPVAIGFLASLVGLNGVARRVREIIERVRSRVQTAINRMITRIVGRFRGRAPQQNGQSAPAQSTAANGQNQLRQGVMAGVAAVNQQPGAQIGAAAISPLLAPLKQRYGLSVLEPVVQNGHWAIHGEIRRMTERTDKEATTDTNPHLRETRYIKDGMLKPEYQSKEKIRRLLYNSRHGYDAAVHEKKRELLERYTDPQNPNNWIDPAINRSVPKTNVTIEHEYPVWSHWNEEGRNTNQQTRIGWFNFRGRLDDVRIMSREAAAQQGRETTGRYRYDVGPNFKGPDER